MATYVPKGRLVSMTPSGGSTITFDDGRTGLSTYDLDATSPIGYVPGQADVVDLVGSPLQPFEILLPWNVLISCNSGGGTSTAHVQDVSDLVETALYTQQQCTLVAYKLGYGATVSNATCRLVRIESLDEIVAHWKARLTFRCIGVWS